MVAAESGNPVGGRLLRVVDQAVCFAIEFARLGFDRLGVRHFKADFDGAPALDCGGFRH